MISRQQIADAMKVPFIYAAAGVINLLNWGLERLAWVLDKPKKRIPITLLCAALVFGIVGAGAKLAVVEGTSQTLTLQVTNGYTTTDCSSSGSGSSSTTSCSHTLRITGVVNGGNTETFVVKDVHELFIFNSADIWAELAAQKHGDYGVYRVTVYGWRSGFFSSFRGIYRIDKVVQQP